MKAILVIDKHDNCIKCPCHNGEWGYCQADKEERQIHYEGFPNWCPLKPLPDYKDETETTFVYHYIAKGYNQCLAEINGKTITRQEKIGEQNENKHH